MAEYGRQPWTIAGMLPTWMSASSLTVTDLYMTISAFTLFYGIFAVVEVYLMVKYARLGPSSLKTGRYHFEQNNSGDTAMSTH